MELNLTGRHGGPGGAGLSETHDEYGRADRVSPQPTGKRRRGSRLPGGRAECCQAGAGGVGAARSSRPSPARGALRMNVGTSVPQLGDLRGAPELTQ